MRSLILISALIIATGQAHAVASGAARTKSEVTSPTWSVTNVDGRNVEICAYGEKNAKSCITREHPNQTGIVREITQGKFLSLLRPAWISSNDSTASLCTLDNSAENVVCIGLKTPKRFQEYHFVTNDGKLLFGYKDSRKVDSNDKAISRAAQQFANRLELGAARLQKRADRSIIVRQRHDSTPVMSLINTGGGCYTDEEYYECDPDTGGGNSGGGAILPVQAELATLVRPATQPLFLRRVNSSPLSKRETIVLLHR